MKQVMGQWRELERKGVEAQKEREGHLRQILSSVKDVRRVAETLEMDNGRSQGSSGPQAEMWPLDEQRKKALLQFFSIGLAHFSKQR
ncbi:MAG: hypothetical protein GY820_19920 [Gammaproteobacteria bacterium]|nr:hypothetical protein [Gammaproteobacteria bacterium]